MHHPAAHRWLRVESQAFASSPCSCFVREKLFDREFQRPLCVAVVGPSLASLQERRTGAPINCLNQKPRLPCRRPTNCQDHIASGARQGARSEQVEMPLPLAPSRSRPLACAQGAGRSRHWILYDRVQTPRRAVVPSPPQPVLWRHRASPTCRRTGMGNSSSPIPHARSRRAQHLPRPVAQLHREKR